MNRHQKELVKIARISQKKFKKIEISFKSRYRCVKDLLKNKSIEELKDFRKFLIK